MNMLIKKIQNIGIDSNTDLDSAKRIRLCNSMSLAGMGTSFVVLLYGYLSNWPLLPILILGIIFVGIFFPIVLNLYKKTLAARTFFLIVSYSGILSVCIVLGSAFQFQHFLFLTLGLPIMFFGEGINKKNIFWLGLGIPFYIYAEWHFTVFEPLVNVDLYNASLIRVINNLITMLVVSGQFYFVFHLNKTYVEELKAKSKALKEKNIQLEHFAYIASHDLNEPLRTVNSFVDIIQEEYEDTVDENLSTYFSFIREALHRMRLMIDSLLKYSLIGKSSDCQMVNTNYLIINIEADLGELIKRQNVTIKANNLPVINCLAQETRQLFQNLITNAIKFRQADVTPIIEITYKEKNKYWQFCVADNGIGISSKKHQEIFQMFTRLHLPEKYKGHGIGLAFCKKIVEAHKGKIWVESSLGNGSQFYFTIQKKFKN